MVFFTEQEFSNKFAKFRGYQKAFAVRRNKYVGIR